MRKIDFIDQLIISLCVVFIIVDIIACYSLLPVRQATELAALFSLSWFLFSILILKKGKDERDKK